MATTYTSNYNLGKQEDKNDNFSMDVITENMDKIDAALSSHELDTNNLILDIIKLIIKNKSNHEVGLFHNVPFDIEFDDSQLNN